MTYKEIIYKYKDLFIMLVEKAGRETGNKYYLDIDRLFSENAKIDLMIESLCREEPDFKVVVCSFVVALLCEIYGIDEIKTWDGDKSYQVLTEFYQLYLRKPSKSFCEKYGLESFDDPDTSFILYNIDKNGRE